MLILSETWEKMCAVSRVPFILTLLIAFNSSYHVHCSHCESGRSSECTADSCITCFGVEADCNFNNVTNTLHCQPNISRCSLKLCEVCESCTGTVVRSPGQEWTLTSHCFNVVNSICELGEITDQCIVTETVTDSVLMANIEGDEIFSAGCICNGENCTQEFVLSYSIIPEQPIPSPLGTPTITPAVTDTSGKLSVSYSVIIGILSGLVIVGLITVTVTALWLLRRRKQSRQSIPQGNFPNNTALNGEATTGTSNSAAIHNTMAYDTDGGSAKNSSNAVTAYGGHETDGEGRTGSLHKYTEPDNERRAE